MIHLGDIKNINGAEIEPVDIITAGSPCIDRTCRWLAKEPDWKAREAVCSWNRFG